MKTALIFLFIGILLLAVWSMGIKIWIRDTVDIHISDTYLVIEKKSFFLIILLYLLTFFSIGGIIGTRAHNKIFLLLFVISTSAIAWYLWKIFRH